MDEVAALGHWRDSSLFDARERSALDYAEAVTLSGPGVTESHFDALRRHFTDDAIIELTGVIAFQNLSSKFNAALGVPPQGFCELPTLLPGNRAPTDRQEFLRPSRGYLADRQDLPPTHSFVGNRNA